MKKQIYIQNYSNEMKWNNYKREERNPSFHSFSVLPNTQKTIISPLTPN